MRALTIDNGVVGADQSGPSRPGRPKKRWRKVVAFLVGSGLLATLVGVVADKASDHISDVDTDAPDGSASGTAAGCTSLQVLQRTAAKPQQILAQGHCTLGRADGLDADSGRLENQDAGGVDLSPKGGNLEFITGNNRGSLAHLAVLPEQGSVDYSRCSDSALHYSKDVRNVPNMRVGDQLCLRTDQGNIGLLTLTKNAEDRLLSIDFTTWAAP